MLTTNELRIFSLADRESSPSELAATNAAAVAAVEVAATAADADDDASAAADDDDDAPAAAALGRGSNDGWLSCLAGRLPVAFLESCCVAGAAPLLEAAASVGCTAAAAAAAGPDEGEGLDRLAVQGMRSPLRRSLEEGGRWAAGTGEAPEPSCRCAGGLSASSRMAASSLLTPHDQ